MRSFVTALLALLVTCGLARQAGAQCFPDNFDSAICCTPVTPNIPSIPFMQQNGRFICFRNCGVQVNAQICSIYGPMLPAMQGLNIVCNVFTMRFQVKSCGPNQVLWSGNLRLHYSRNWQELGPSPGVVRTVWRFMANGDLVPTSALPAIPNVKPPCSATNVFGKAYFAGYFDFAYDCSSNTWSSAYALQHECDFASHGTGSARPLASSHPTRSYVFVGPAAGFVASSVNPATSGGLTFDAVRRNNWPTLPNICLAEEPLGAGGTLLPVRPYCECVTSSTINQFNDTVLQGGGQCGTTFNTLAPPIGPIPFTQKSIGAWTIAGTFPEQKTLFFTNGTMLHNDGCTATTSTQYFEGVETINNNSAMLSVGFNGVAFGGTFLDLASSNGVGGATLTGAPHVVWYLLNLNL
jgi:hypothetical protein